MSQPVALADVRAVGDPVERPRLHTERLAQILHVGDRVVRAEELAARSDLAGAGADGRGTRRRQVRAPHLALERLAVERAGARPALVEDDDAVLALLRRERTGDEAVEDRQPRLSGPTREDEEHTAWRVDVVAHPDLKVQGAPSGMRVIERDIARRARVPIRAWARMRAVQPGAARGGSPGERERGESQQRKQETRPHVSVPTRDRRAG